MPFVGAVDGNAGFKQFAALVSFVAACIGIVQGIEMLKGNGPSKTPPSPTSAASTPPCCTPTLPSFPSPTLPSFTAPTLPSFPEPTPAPEPPDFIVISANWVRPCINGTCTMSATFRNIGGDGSAAAIFHVRPARGGGDLARCSATIWYTVAQGSTSTGCSAYSGELARHFAIGGRVQMRVEVDNPY